jgi:hypothetical protein
MIEVVPPKLWKKMSSKRMSRLLLLVLAIPMLPTTPRRMIIWVPLRDPISQSTSQIYQGLAHVATHSPA